jgi:cytoskeletal protein RodZ
VGSLTARGRVLVVAAFVLSAALCAGAAVAFVRASNDDSTAPRALASASPSATPSEQPTPTATSTPTPTVTPTATATAAPTSSPSPRHTATSKPTRTSTRVKGLSAQASLDLKSGGTTDDVFHILARATDGNGTISLQSLDWGDGSPLVEGGRGSACNPAATAPADCRTFAWSHQYAQAGPYIVTIVFASGAETAILQLTPTVDEPSPSPTS